MTPVDTTIVMVSYNTRELTLRALAAAREAARGLETVMVVADNGSSDGTPAALHSAFPSVGVVVYPDNPGYGSALNRAVAAFPASNLCALNGDVLLGERSLRVLRQFLTDHSECGMVGPALTYPDGHPQPSAKRFPSLRFALAEILCLHSILPGNRSVGRFYYEGQDLANYPWVDTVSGAAMLIRGEAFRRIGGFDEGFRMYFEETDLCRRLHDAGYRVALCTQATAIHCHGASTIQTSVRQVEYYLSYVRFFRKHYGRGPARILVLGVVVGTVLRMLALPLKYPPISRRGLDALRPKLAACRRLLRDLWRPVTTKATKETLS